MNKPLRQQVVGVDRRRLHACCTDFPNGYPQNPNKPGVEDRTTWNFKATGQLRRAVRHPHLAGAASPVGRELRPHGHDLGAGRLGPDRHRHGVYVEPTNANREDNIWVFDVRAEKTLNLGGRAARLRLCFDLFNLTNSHASETISRATGLGT